jgi:uncharacterized protein YqfA (UPF0365 family)
VMDYYRIRNVQADTTMRENIGNGGAETPSPDARAGKP